MGLKKTLCSISKEHLVDKCWFEFKLHKIYVVILYVDTKVLIWTVRITILVNIAYNWKGELVSFSAAYPGPDRGGNSLRWTHCLFLLICYITLLAFYLAFDIVIVCRKLTCHWIHLIKKKTKKQVRNQHISFWWQVFHLNQQSKNEWWTCNKWTLETLLQSLPRKNCDYPVDRRHIVNNAALKRHKQIIPWGIKLPGWEKQSFEQEENIRHYQGPLSISTPKVGFQSISFTKSCNSANKSINKSILQNIITHDI